MPAKVKNIPSQEQAPILYQDPEELPIVDELKNFMQNNSIPNLRQLLEYKGFNLLEMKGFTYRSLDSFMGVLEDHDLLHLFEEN